MCYISHKNKQNPWSEVIQERVPRVVVVSLTLSACISVTKGLRRRIIHSLPITPPQSDHCWPTSELQSSRKDGALVPGHLLFPCKFVTCHLYFFCNCRVRVESITVRVSRIDRRPSRAGRTHTKFPADEMASEVTSSSPFRENLGSFDMLFLLEE